jgi:hypothetical protein
VWLFEAGLCWAMLGPVRFCMAWLFEVWSGMLVWSPVRLGQVLFGSAMCGKVSLWFGEVLIGVAGFTGVLYSKARSYFLANGDVGRGGVRFYCGMVWNREALFRVVKFCPVKHGLVGLGITWSGDVRWSVVRKRAVMHAKALLRSGIVRRSTVGSGLARLRVAGQAMVLLRRGQVWLGTVLSCNVWQGSVLLWCGGAA